MIAACNVNHSLLRSHTLEVTYQSLGVCTCSGRETARNTLGFARSDYHNRTYPPLVQRQDKYRLRPLQVTLLAMGRNQHKFYEYEKPVTIS